MEIETTSKETATQKYFPFYHWINLEKLSFSSLIDIEKKQVNIYSNIQMIDGAEGF